MEMNYRLTNKGVVAVEGSGAVLKPGILWTSPRGVVELQNETGEAIDVFLPVGADEDGRFATIQSCQSRSFTLGGTEGIYPFAVFSHQTGDFARGNSSPRVIIK
jgi:hypothetical protein